MGPGIHPLRSSARQASVSVAPVVRTSSTRTIALAPSSTLCTLLIPIPSRGVRSVIVPVTLLRRLLNGTEAWDGPCLRPRTASISAPKTLDAPCANSPAWSTPRAIRLREVIGTGISTVRPGSSPAPASRALSTSPSRRPSTLPDGTQREYLSNSTCSRRTPS